MLGMRSAGQPSRHAVDRDVSAHELETTLAERELKGIAEDLVNTPENSEVTITGPRKLD